MDSTKVIHGKKQVKEIWKWGDRQKVPLKTERMTWVEPIALCALMEASNSHSLQPMDPLKKPYVLLT